MQVRTTKTGSGNTAVQIVQRFAHQTKIIKHLGSAKDKEALDDLFTLAYQYIREAEQTIPLFPEVKGGREQTHLVDPEKLEFTKTYHHFAYEFFSFFYERNGFHKIVNPILKDLAIMRLIEPTSKQESIELLKEYFRITYGNDRLYNGLRLLHSQKEQTEQIAITYAKKNLSFDFSLVFYDVTTLYFETFKADEDTTDDKGNKTIGFRKNGFGKEPKIGQPIIVIGLLVNNDGYPLAVEMFSGKTFEGHTILPVVKNLKERYGIKTLTIVADAAMLSLDNTKALADSHLHYIVGARMGGIGQDLLLKIAKRLNKTENKYIRLQTDWGTLICDYSDKRAAKDRSDRKKQIAKAQYQIDNPGKVKRKNRFVMEETKATLTLNQLLIEQDTLREGIKGYYTNLKKVPSRLIVKRYHDLWHVEKAFRIAKSDLAARPIFHHKKENIEAHIIIVFVSLCIAKSIELLSHLSIKKVKKTVWPVLDIEFTDTLSNKTFIKRMKTDDNPMAQLWKALQR
jgi:transposase